MVKRQRECRRSDIALASRIGAVPWASQLCGFLRGFSGSALHAAIEALEAILELLPRQLRQDRAHLEEEEEQASYNNL